MEFKIIRDFGGCCELDEESANKLQLKDNEKYVVLSDDENAGTKWQDYAVIGVENGKNIYGVQYVVKSVEDVDEDLLYRAYCRKNKLPLNICESEHLLIREMSVGDLKELTRLYELSDCRYIPTLRENEKTPGFVENYIRNMYEFYELGLWLAFDRKSNEIIGRGGIEICEIRGTAYYEIAYMIRNDYQGRGLGFELAQAVLAQADKRSINKLIARINEKNLPSVKLIQRLGFTLREKLTDGDEVLCIYAN